MIPFQLPPLAVIVNPLEFKIILLNQSSDTKSRVQVVVNVAHVLVIQVNITDHVLVSDQVS